MNMKNFKEFTNQFLFKCDNCGRLREAVEFYDVPVERKDVIREMIKAMESDAISNDRIESLIVYCKKCDEYSVMCLGGGGDWINEN